MQKPFYALAEALLKNFFSFSGKMKKRKCFDRIRCMTNSLGSQCRCENPFEITIKQCRFKLLYCAPREQEIKPHYRSKMKNLLYPFGIMIGGGSYMDFSYHDIYHHSKHLYIFNWCIFTIDFSIKDKRGCC